MQPVQPTNSPASSVPQSSNARQEGGNHYTKNGRALQHWDVVVIFDLDYFQGQISKYIFRWKDKHDDYAGKLLDLKKARHFLDKYIEEVESGRVVEMPVDMVGGHPVAKGYVEQ